MLLDLSDPPLLHSYQVATGSNDDTIRIWDLRMHQAIATIPGHKSAISDLKFFQAPPRAGGSDSYPLTDVPRAFNEMPVFMPSGSSAGEPNPDANGDKAAESEANGAGGPGGLRRDDEPDFPVSGSFLVSCGFDGFVKVWSADDWQQVRALSNDQAGKVMSVDVSSGASLVIPMLPHRFDVLTITRTVCRRTLHRRRAVRQDVPAVLRPARRPRVDKTRRGRKRCPHTRCLLSARVDPRGCRRLFARQAGERATPEATLRLGTEVRQAGPGVGLQRDVATGASQQKTPSRRERKPDRASVLGRTVAARGLSLRALKG